MRLVVTSLLVAGCVSSTALAFQAGNTGGASKACALLTRDLATKVSTAAGRKALERAKPDENPEGMTIAKGASVCDYGPKNHEPVSGVGDAAFFDSNSSFANLYVWTGSRHFSIQMRAGFQDDAKALKANVIELAKAIVPQLR